MVRRIRLQCHQRAALLKVLILRPPVALVRWSQSLPRAQQLERRALVRTVTSGSLSGRPLRFVHGAGNIMQHLSTRSGIRRQDPAKPR